MRDEYEQSRFCLVMENSNIKGYITEKIMYAFQAGCIPIYWGSQGVIKTFYNPKTFIDISDFKTIDELVRYVIKVDHTSELYQNYINAPSFPNPKIQYLNLTTESPIIQTLSDKIKDFYLLKNV